MPHGTKSAEPETHTNPAIEAYSENLSAEFILYAAIKRTDQVKQGISIVFKVSVT